MPEGDGTRAVRSIKRHVLAATISITVLLNACKKDDGPTTSAAAVEPKLSSIQANIIDVSCATPSCHGTGAGGLVLTTGNSFSQLINVPSQNDGAHTPPFLRVKPRSPDSSFLIIKLTNPGTNQGVMMPRICTRLTDDNINAIRTWITNGAPNN